MKTIGHHTCKRDGGKAYVELNSPFFSSKSSRGKTPFLGSGYYFWDNNLGQAKAWGKINYSNKYFIVQSELEFTSNQMLDLVGNRSHMIYFLDLYRKFSSYYDDGNKWVIGEFIELLKKLNSKPEYKGIFDFEASRAIDLHQQHNSKNITFSEEMKNYTNLNPCLVICLYNKKNIILRSEILISQN